RAPARRGPAHAVRPGGGPRGRGGREHAGRRPGDQDPQGSRPGPLGEEAVGELMVERKTVRPGSSSPSGATEDRRGPEGGNSMETAKVDIRKLQLLNDRINQCLEALSQVRLTVHGLSHTAGQIPGQGRGLPSGVAAFGY